MRTIRQAAAWDDVEKSPKFLNLTEFSTLILLSHWSERFHNQLLINTAEIRGKLFAFLVTIDVAIYEDVE